MIRKGSMKTLGFLVVKEFFSKKTKEGDWRETMEFTRGLWANLTFY